MQRDPAAAAAARAGSPSIFSSHTFASSSTGFFASSSSPSSSRPPTRDGPPPPPIQPPPVPPIPPSSSSSSADSHYHHHHHQHHHQQQHSHHSQQHSSSGTSIFSRDRRPSFGRRSSNSGSRRRSNSASNSGAADAVVTDTATPPALPDYALAAAAKITSKEVAAISRPTTAAGSSSAIGTTTRIEGGADVVRSPVSPEGLIKTLSRTATGASTATSMNPNYSNPYLTGPATFLPPPSMPQNEAGAIHQQITDLANKRISTLDYLHKAHEGRIYWFNTYLFDKPDLNRMSSFDPRKLARKATNYLLLGLSLPTINDLYSSSPLEYLRSLNTLLSEFDSFQQLHNDSSNSLARARLPNMFRRQGKPRRSTTSASDGPMPEDGFGAGGGAGGGPAPSVMNFAASESGLLPGEEYSHLLTPALPFDPDFFETFATLCDVLIDCYQRFLALVPTPKECSVPVAELFSKADGRVRKLIVQGVVKDFEEQSRSHVKAEVASIGKVVLGGLM